MIKLLAVVTLATATPALADTATPPVDPWAGPTEPAPPIDVSPQVREQQALAFVERIVRAFGITEPRRLPSGAPACGNVQSKSPASARCEPAVRTAQHLTSATPATTGRR